MDIVDCVCVVYNPDLERLKQCIDSVCSQVNHVWIIDNSDCNIDLTKISCIRDNISICSLHENMGIAYALNYGCHIAISNGAQWVLTLDQDSIVPPNMISSYLDILENENNKNIGIVCCNIQCCDNYLNMTPGLRMAEEKLCWTSGSLMNLECYKLTGGFNNELFIDGVDFDYCYSLRNLGFRILKDCMVIMDHKLGESKVYKFLGHYIFYITNHNRIRWYYIVRNSLWISHKYSDNYPEAKFSYLGVLKFLCKIILFEKDKINKVKSIIKGCQDFKSNRFGKYSG